ncbi:FtsX-like permease family protein [Streptomyces sp. NEAU-W12]|uniref:FtsX-like permease family protein n=1 Tax=Streptomyces sp. NEAU-W12 TaxID=2994668 RepID=UPI00224AE366|nr:FtsX-like permease family protein [Streptomyces sp. NEAU-W12]MCX2925384.1 ABC transporter permease [Streptomyces sp. NEAU-W12]
MNAARSSHPRFSHTLRSDLRLAWLLTHGSDRREWWRITLTATGAALATGFALAAGILLSLGGRSTGTSVAEGLLDQPGTRAGVILGLLLLLVPVLGFLGQCARVGAVHRDRRLAGLRLAGATPWQVRRVAALETGLACLLGSAVATVFSVLLLMSLEARPDTLAWVAVVLVAVTVPVLGAASGALALRRVVASPLGRVRRVTEIRSARGPGRLFLGGAALVVAVGVVSALAGRTSAGGADWGFLVTVFAALLTVGAGAVWLAGASSRLIGRALAGRARSAAVLIAAERLRADPWAAARTHAAMLLVTVVGTGFMGVRHAFLAALHRDGPSLAGSTSYYTTGLNLTAAAITVAVLITLTALAVGTAESPSTRRRGLAAQTAAGVPRPVLHRALLLETALPLAPALLLAGIGGLAFGTGYGTLTAAPSLPWSALLVPPAAYTACLLASATALPLLSRSAAPSQLRYT